MSAPELNRFDELVSRYLDGALGDADEHELSQSLADETLAARFHELTRLDTEIAGLLSGSLPDDVMTSLVLSDVRGEKEMAEPNWQGEWAAKRRGSPVKLGRRPLLLAWAAAAVLLIGIATFIVPRKSAPLAASRDTPIPSPTGSPAKMAGTAISTVQGEAYVSGLKSRRSVIGAAALSEGETVETVGRESRAVVTFGDSSEIELRGDTTLSVEAVAKGRHLFLRQGMVVARVAKQPEGAPMLFKTERATVTVRGTRLAVVTEKDGAYLIVMEGAASLQSVSSGQEVLINSGFYGHVELGTQFRPFPIARLPRALRADLPPR